MFHAGSEIGKQLDSLSDMVSFGVLPGMIMYFLLTEGFKTSGVIQSGEFHWIAFSGFLLTACSAFRLARFNLEEGEPGWFTGLATPSNTFFMAGLLFIYHYGSTEMATRISQPFVLIAITILFSYLLVSPIRMFNVKFRPNDRPGNIKRGVAILVGLTGLALLREYGPSVMVVLYILYNIGEHLFFSGKKKPRALS